MTSKQEYIRTVKLILAVYANNLWRVMPGDFSHYFNGVDLDKAFSGSAGSENELARLNPFFLHTCLHWFEFTYEYGVNGVLTVDPSQHDCYDIEDYLPFWEGLKAAQEFLINNGPDVDYRFELIDWGIEKARCRRLMDGFSHHNHFGESDFEPSDGHIFLKELATLADLDEKTIRNMASAAKGDFPKTLKEGSRTLVDRKEAHRWLKSRGWKDTVHLYRKSELQVIQAGFSHRASLMEFLGESLESHNLPAALHKRLKAIVNGLGNGCRFDIEPVKKWAAIMGVPEAELLMAFFGLHHRLELQEFTKLIHSETENLS